MSENQFYNKLQHESSPYLLQHARNPVNWYPWGEEALSKAMVEDKLIIVSIGYAACHWCHVMEHQSFEDEVVAKVMNENFVCVKVDREERPDIDQVYMNAVQLITGGGGWPLNCFALPDGSPVYGGTYFPKENWFQVLNSLAEYWKNDKQKLLEHALQIKRGMLGTDIVVGKTKNSNIDLEVMDELVESWKSNFDTEFGGENHAPKFPMPNNYEFLLTYVYFTNHSEVSGFIELTLDKMADGGIYDHVGGGFSRYSVDKYWKVPHFEKMLYDNAQLVCLYSRAYKMYKKDKYKKVVTETIDFLIREMLSPDGGFYSSFDADSEGEEGKFYVWGFDEIKQVLGEKSKIVADYYSVKKEGNWEKGNNILHVTNSPELICKAHHLNIEEIIKVVSESNELLFEYRKNRIHPSLDDKILTSWNALLIIGLLEAYQSLRDKRFLKMAIENTVFLCDKNLQDDGKLFRNHKNGKSTINAFLDDYGFFAHALIKLYSVTGNRQWLMLSEKLIKYALSHFYDASSGMFFYTSTLDAPLVVRKMEISDNVIPSSNSVMAKNLFLLSIYLGNDNYEKMARQMLANVTEDMIKYNRYCTNWAELASWSVYPFFEVVIVGDKSEELAKEFFEQAIPNCAIAFSNEQSDELMFKNRFVAGKTLIYVCQGNTCKKPVETVSEAIGIIKG